MRSMRASLTKDTAAFESTLDNWDQGTFKRLYRSYGKIKLFQSDAETDLTHGLRVSGTWVRTIAGSLQLQN